MYLYLDIYVYICMYVYIYICQEYICMYIEWFDAREQFYCHLGTYSLRGFICMIAYLALSIEYVV